MSEYVTFPAVQALPDDVLGCMCRHVSARESDDGGEDLGRQKNAFCTPRASHKYRVDWSMVPLARQSPVKWALNTPEHCRTHGFWRIFIAALGYGKYQIISS